MSFEAIATQAPISQSELKRFYVLRDARLERERQHKEALAEEKELGKRILDALLRVKQGTPLPACFASGLYYAQLQSLGARVDWEEAYVKAMGEPAADRLRESAEKTYYAAVKLKVT